MDWYGYDPFYYIAGYRKYPSTVIYSHHTTIRRQILLRIHGGHRHNNSGVWWGYKYPAARVGHRIRSAYLRVPVKCCTN